jgi:hypothetical protein
MKFTYISISEKDFSKGIVKVNEMARDGWKLINAVTRGGSFYFVIEKEVSQ